MVCVNQEELGAHIHRVASPGLNVDADILSLEFTQIFALGKVLNAKIPCFFGSTCWYLLQWNVPCRRGKGGPGGPPPEKLRPAIVRTSFGRGWHPNQNIEVFLPGAVCTHQRELAADIWCITSLMSSLQKYENCGAGWRKNQKF